MAASLTKEKQSHIMCLLVGEQDATCEVILPKQKTKPFIKRLPLTSTWQKILLHYREYGGGGRATNPTTAQGGKSKTQTTGSTTSTSHNLRLLHLIMYTGER
jgi:hypothetical protein